MSSKSVRGSERCLRVVYACSTSARPERVASQPILTLPPPTILVLGVRPDERSPFNRKSFWAEGHRNKPVDNVSRGISRCRRPSQWHLNSAHTQYGPTSATDGVLHYRAAEQGLVHSKTLVLGPWPGLREGCHAFQGAVTHAIVLRA